MKTESYITESLRNVINQAYSLKDPSKYVIFSDLHLGNGGFKDDFKKNGDLFTKILREYYLKKDYTLILNGDIEELQKFKLNEIMNTWTEIYSLLDRFAEKNKLYKTVGNHDYSLNDHLSTYPYPIYDSLKINSHDQDIYIFHGHQASHFFSRYNHISGFLLRYMAKPLGIKNLSISHNSRKKFLTEKRIYEFASKNKIVTIIGHTHRPLFESLSKTDYLRFSIEKLCRNYPRFNQEGKQKVEKLIHEYKEELKKTVSKKNPTTLANNLYTGKLVIPCLFNSGCAIGKRGITCLEIRRRSIALIYWFPLDRVKSYHFDEIHEFKKLEGIPYCRITIKKDKMKYIATRIKLLTW